MKPLTSFAHDFDAIRAGITGWVALVPVLVLAIAVRILFFHGFSPGDPYTYGFEAWQIAAGEWRVPTYVASLRWGIILPTAALYKLFGVNEVTSTLWPFACSLGALVLAFLLGRRIAGDEAGVTAALLVGLFPLGVANSTQLLGDTPLELWLLLSLYAMVRGNDLGTRGGGWFLLAGAAFALAFTTKAIALFAGPFFALAFVSQRPLNWSMLLVGAGFAILFAAECLFYYHTTGDPLYRFNVGLEARDARGVLFDPASFDYLQSILRYPYWMFVDIHYVGVPFVVFAALLIYLRSRGIQLGKGTGWPLLLSGVLIAVLTLYPLSADPYIPLYKAPNYMLVFTAPLLVVLAVALTKLSTRARQTLLSLILLSYGGVILLSYESMNAHTENVKQAYRYIAEQDPATPIYADLYSIAVFEYYDGYQPRRDYLNYSIVNRVYSDTQNPAYVPDRGLVVVDEYFIEHYARLSHYGRTGHRYPPVIRNIPDSWRPVFSFLRETTGIRQSVAYVVASLKGGGLISATLATEMNDKLERWSHTRPVTIYAVN